MTLYIKDWKEFSNISKPSMTQLLETSPELKGILEDKEFRTFLKERRRGNGGRGNQEQQNDRKRFCYKLLFILISSPHLLCLYLWFKLELRSKELKKGKDRDMQKKNSTLVRN